MKAYVLTKKAEKDGIGPAGSPAEPKLSERFTRDYFKVHEYAEEVDVEDPAPTGDPGPAVPEPELPLEPEVGREADVPYTGDVPAAPEAGSGS